MGIAKRGVVEYRIKHREGRRWTRGMVNHIGVKVHSRIRRETPVNTHRTVRIHRGTGIGHVGGHGYG